MASGQPGGSKAVEAFLSDVVVLSTETQHHEDQFLTKPERQQSALAGPEEKSILRLHHGLDPCGES